MHKVFTQHCKKKEIEAQSLYNLLADGQLLIYVADALPPSIIYLWVICCGLTSSLVSLSSHCCERFLSETGPGN